MRLGLTLVSTVCFLSVFLPVLALPPAGISTPPSLAKRNDRNAFSDIEARSPHMVTLKKRFWLFSIFRGIAKAIEKIVGAVKHAIHRGRAAAKRKSESKRVQTAVKHADRGRRGAEKANKVSNNIPQNNQPNNGQNGGHRRRSLLDPRGEQVYPELGNKMKRTLVHQKLNRRMKRQLRERQSNTGFDELD